MADDKKEEGSYFFDWLTKKKVPTSVPTPMPSPTPGSVEGSDEEMLEHMRRGRR